MTCKELCLLQMHLQVRNMFVTSQWSGQLMNGWPYLSQIKCASPKPGSSTTTERLILETEAGTVGKGKDRTADWPVN